MYASCRIIEFSWILKELLFHHYRSALITNFHLIKLRWNRMQQRARNKISLKINFMNRKFKWQWKCAQRVNWLEIMKNREIFSAHVRHSWSFVRITMKPSLNQFHFVVVTLFFFVPNNLRSQHARIHYTIEIISSPFQHKIEMWDFYWQKPWDAFTVQIHFHLVIWGRSINFLSYFFPVSHNCLSHAKAHGWIFKRTILEWIDENNCAMPDLEA